MHLTKHLCDHKVIYIRLLLFFFNLKQRNKTAFNLILFYNMFVKLKRSQTTLTPMNLFLFFFDR